MSGPYWLEDDSPAPVSRRGGGSPDRESLGAGITGCSAALALAREGRSVVVHDARGIAEGASGRNGGFALRGGAARYDVARETYGDDASRELWRRTEAALDGLEAVGGDAVRRVGSLRLAADEEELEQIRGEFAALREDGLEAEWLDRLPDHRGGRFLGAIHHPRDGSVQPARLVRRLAVAAASEGAEFRDHSRVETLDQLEAPTVLLATDGYGRGLVPELDERIWPARGQVVATEPLDERRFDIPHYARQGFDYWQQLPDGRLVAGGFRDHSIMDELTDLEETTPVIQSALESFIEDLLG